MSLWDFDKEVANEFCNKYKINMKTIKIKDLTLYQFFISDTDFDTSSILFTKNKNTTFYEPYIYNYRENKGGIPTGSIILKNTCYYDWILTVRKVFGRYNNSKRRYEEGSLYVLQWIISLDVLDNILNNTGRTIQLLATRQWTRSCL